MKFQKIIIALVAVCAFTFTSCTENSAEDDTNYDEQNVRRHEFKDIDRT